MNANENLGKKRKNARAIVVLGVVLMSIGIIPFFYFYAIFVPANQGKELVSIPGIILVALYIGMVSFVLGLVVVLIGLLKKQESL